MTSRKRKPGRPRALTAQVRKDILTLAACNAPIMAAARAAGISYRALRSYLDDASDQYDAKFAAQFAAAKRRSRIAMHRTIMRAARKDWRAAIRGLTADETGSYTPQLSVHTDSSIEIKHTLDVSAKVRSNPSMLEAALLNLVDMAAKPIAAADKVALPAVSDREAVTIDG